MAAEHGDLEYKRLHKVDEKNESPWYTDVVYDGNHNVAKGKPASFVLFDLESAVIKNIAPQRRRRYCRRCADYILKDTDTKLLTVFISAPFESRVIRKMTINGHGSGKDRSTCKKKWTNREVNFMSRM